MQVTQNVKKFVKSAQPRDILLKFILALITIPLVGELIVRLYNSAFITLLIKWIWTLCHAFELTVRNTISYITQDASVHAIYFFLMGVLSALSLVHRYFILNRPGYRTNFWMGCHLVAVIIMAWWAVVDIPEILPTSTAFVERLYFFCMVSAIFFGFIPVLDKLVEYGYDVLVMFFLFVLLYSVGFLGQYKKEEILDFWSVSNMALLLVAYVAGGVVDHLFKFGAVGETSPDKEIGRE